MRLLPKTWWPIETVVAEGGFVVTSYPPCDYFNTATARVVCLDWSRTISFLFILLLAKDNARLEDAKDGIFRLGNSEFRGRNLAFQKNTMFEPVDVQSTSAVWIETGSYHSSA